MAESDWIDKVLWEIRAFKTRTDATEACKGGKVKVDSAAVKPSRLIKPGDTVTVHKGIVQYTYRFKRLPSHRLGAKLVPEFVENLTPQEELDYGDNLLIVDNSDIESRINRCTSGSTLEGESAEAAEDEPAEDEAENAS